MKYIVTYSQVAACTIIILQIRCVTALTLKNVSTQIMTCEDEAIQLNWEYELNPNDNIDAKTWSYTKDGKTIPIGQWTNQDGPILESNFESRVTIIENNSIIIRNITTRDGGTYTLTLFLRQSSQPNPKLSLNLTVLKPPLTGCCKPTIQRLENGTGLRADLDPQACGTGPFELMWNNASLTKSDGNVLRFLDSSLTGKFTVCVTGLTIQKCFKGKRESLCQDEKIEETSKVPQTTEQNTPIVVGLSVSGTIILLAVSLVILLIVKRSWIQKYRWRNKKWKTIRDNLQLTDDAQLLRSLIPTEEMKENKAMKKLSKIVYVAFKCSRDLALEEINTTPIENENSEIVYIDNVTDSGDGENRTKDCLINPSYAQSFYHKDKLLKLLVVQGELGIVKTTWCRKLVSTWCNAYECQYHETPAQTNDKNIQTMKSFPLLFFVSLRNAERGQTLKNIIKQQCVMGNDATNEGFVVKLELLMKNRPDKLIFIFHGLDEAEADVDILKELVSQTKNSLTILTCHDWDTLRSRCRIQESEYRPMAFLTFTVNIYNVELYAKTIFVGYGYPKDAEREFMELIRRNKLETFMKETYFVQPLINIWHKSGLLPSDATDVCLCLIEDSLKERKKILKSARLNLDSEVDRVPKVRGKIFVISYGKVLYHLGQFALTCLQKNANSIFDEEEIWQRTNTTTTAKELIEICIAAKLISTVPVSDSSTVNKRLRFQNKIIQYFLVAFHLACKGESQVKDIQSEEREKIQTFVTSLVPVSYTN